YTTLFRSHRDWPVQVGRDRIGRTRLLAREAEVSDLDWSRRVAQIVDLGHAARAPSGNAGHEVGNSGVAFPPALVRVSETGESLDQSRRLGHGDVPDLVRLRSEGAQQVDRAAI